MKIAKEYKWEMGHRLTFHTGKCKNLHGHSYKMRIEITGGIDKNGMILDYFVLDNIVNPIIDNLDHSVIVYKNDVDLLEMLKKLNFRHVILENECTAENITNYLLEKLRDSDIINFASNIKIRVYETLDSYAEESINL